MVRLGSSFLFIIFCLHAWAQISGVTATVDRNSMSVGDTFTYSVSVDSSSSVQIGKPEWPNFSGFDLINNWSGSEIQSVYENGSFKTKRKQTFNLQLQARQEGVFEIGATSLQVEGQVYRTKPITISVNARGTRQPNLPRARRQTPPNDVDDMFSQMLRDRMRRYGGGKRAPASAGA